MVENILNMVPTLNFSDPLFWEVEKLGKLSFFETDLISGKFKASKNYKRIFKLPEKAFYEVEEFQKLIHPKDTARVLEGFNTSLKERKNFECEYRVFLKGDVRYIRVKSVIVLDDNKNPIKVIGLVQDISDDKKAEAEREKQIKKLEQAFNIAKSAIHDLKASTHDISMSIEALKESSDGDKESVIEILEKSSQRSFEIIDDVLENDLVEESSYSIAKGGCFIHKLIDKAVCSLYYTAKKKNIKVFTALQPDIYAKIHPAQLQRAVENLLFNAIKFSHRDSQIVVNLYGKRKTFVIKVEDFGLGMDAFQKALLIKKDNSGSQKEISDETSIGLGLNIIKKITNQHGGKVKVESQDSVGTTIYIELPRA